MASKVVKNAAKIVKNTAKVVKNAAKVVKNTAEVVKNTEKVFSVKDSVKSYKLQALKQLSQNFILNEGLCRKVIKQAGNLTDKYVCEVGPGPGGLTKAILIDNVKMLSVIEKDERFFPALEELNKSTGGKIKFYHGDVLRFNMHEVFPDEIAMKWEDSIPNAAIIGNLPFAVSTPLIIRWLKEISNREGAWSRGRVPLTLTFQKEVADRMVSQVNDKERCRLSIMCQNWCDVQYKFTIKSSQFVPAPKVDVGVVHFVPKINPEIDVPFDYIEKVMMHVFHYRQKQVKHSLRTLFPHDRPDLLKQLLLESHTHADSKPCQLHMDDMRRLCHAYKKICDEQEGSELLSYNYRSKEDSVNWRNGTKSIVF